jgi:hypothetical protein
MFTVSVITVMKTEAVSASETSVNFCKTAGRNSSEDSHFILPALGYDPSVAGALNTVIKLRVSQPHLILMFFFFQMKQVNTFS